MERRAFLPYVLIIMLAVTYGRIVSFINIVRKRNREFECRVVLSANTTMIMLVRPFAGILFDRKGHKWVLLPGAIFSLVGLLLLSYTTNG